MAYPPIFTLATASSAVTNLIGTSPTRFWPFGRAPQPGGAGYGVPYATHQLAYGTPENTLSCPPDTDSVGIQIDVYAANVSSAREVADALRGALELDGYVVSLNGEFVDEPTGLDRYSFTWEAFAERGS